MPSFEVTARLHRAPVRQEPGGELHRWTYFIHPHVTAAGEGILLQAELTGPTGGLSCSRREGAVFKMVVLAEEEQEEATLLLQEGGLGRVSVAAWERAGREVPTGLD